MNVLVTGVTGYIGGRLVPLLLDEGHRVRVLVRDASRLKGRRWADDVEVVQGSVEDRAAVAEAVQGMDVAYYLVHAIGSGVESLEADRVAATSFAQGASGIPQVVYLGGTVPASAGKVRSSNLVSRAEVGEILRSRLPTTEVRAGAVIGCGSALFEMIRYLTERVPLMVAPRWIKNEVHPIAVSDALSYLVAAAGREDALGVIDVGSEPLTFRDMMLQYAEARGLRRLIVALPFQSRWLDTVWVRLVTPIPGRLAAPLVDSMAHPPITDTARARELFPGIDPISYREAVRRGLESTRRHDIETRWSDALGRTGAARYQDHEGFVREVRTRLVAAPPAAVFRAFSSLGGDRGWLAWNWAWRLRGFLDKLVGGPGLRRGRRDPQNVLPGDAVDFWRVEEVDPPRLLRLRAEMKLPGRGWLQWETSPEDGGTRLLQTAAFEPRGFPGWAYWYGSQFFHAHIFDGMSDAISKMAFEAAAAERATAPPRHASADGRPTP
jgi:uncharacterized protein YbjT (DUF2867 family)/uncharacterized protein YndB with AHSA1/START domain